MSADLFLDQIVTLETICEQTKFSHCNCENHINNTTSIYLSKKHVISVVVTWVEVAVCVCHQLKDVTQFIVLLEVNCVKGR